MKISVSQDDSPVDGIPVIFRWVLVRRGGTGWMLNATDGSETQERETAESSNYNFVMLSFG